jgi:hypothetical protein
MRNPTLFESSIKSHVTVAVKGRENMARQFRRAKVDNEQSAAGFEHSPYLAQTLLTSASRQVMEHHRAQGGVELPVGKGQRLSGRLLKDNRDAGLAGFLFGPGQHLRQSVNPARHPGRPDRPFRGDCEAARPAPDIQDSLARPEIGQLDEIVLEAPLAAKRHQPDHES